MNRGRLPGGIYRGGIADRCPASQIRQRKIGSAIPAVLGSQQREQSLILIDWQQLPITLRPEFWGKTKPRHHDLADKEFTHTPPLVELTNSKRPLAMRCSPLYNAKTPEHKMCFGPKLLRKAYGILPSGAWSFAKWIKLIKCHQFIRRSNNSAKVSRNNNAHKIVGRIESQNFGCRNNSGNCKNFQGAGACKVIQAVG